MTIIDEFDSYVFGRALDSIKKMQVINKSEKIIMFSGSNFQKHHKRFLTEILRAEFVDLSNRNLQKTKPNLEKIEFFTSIKNYRESIVNFVEEQTIKTPVIII